MAAAHLVIGRLSWTGDEPGYVYQGLGLYTAHRLYPTQETWNAFLHANSLAMPYRGPATQPNQSLLLSALFGGILTLFGLEAARWAGFAVACGGLIFLMRWLDLEFNDGSRHARWAIAATLAAFGLSLPLFAYAKLLYPESALFLLVSAACYFVRAPRPYAAVACICALPFVHVRTLPLAVAFFAVLLFSLARTRAAPRTAATLSAIFACGMAAFAAYQIALTGTLGGAAFPTYRPAISAFAERLDMQLFGVRHGIVAYAPLVLAGFAGLALGTARKRFACAWAAILLAVYAATFCWSDAGEALTARFWVAAIPFAAAGLAYWLIACRTWIAVVACAPLAAMQLVNTALFVANQSWFWENRNTSVSYFVLSQIVPVQFGLHLPVDASPLGIPPYAAQAPALSFAAALTIASLALCAAASPRLRAAGVAASLLLCALLAAADAAVPLEPGAYAVRVSPQARSLSVDFPAPLSPLALQFNDKIALAWTAGAYPHFFAVSCWRGAHAASFAIEPSRPLVELSGCNGIDRIDVTGLPPSEGAWFFSSPGNVVVLVRPLKALR